MPVTQLIGPQDQSWSLDAHWRLVCAVALAALLAIVMSDAATKRHGAGFAFSQWIVQTKLSRKGNDLSTLTNKQVLNMRE